MQAYVEELGSTSLCKASDGTGCTDKEKGFIEKWTGKPDVAAQLARLQGMGDAKLKPELKLWLNQRIAILKQLSAAPKDEL